MTQPSEIRRTASRPRTIAIAGLGLAAALGIAAFAVAQSSGPERIVQISAERYEYSPQRVVLKKGEPVILELTSEDRLHGFHVKPLGIRADVVPGHPVRVRVTPDKTGKFPFTCDLFCGSGHNDMGGIIEVIN